MNLWRFNIPARSALILSAVILLSLFVRFRLRDMPLERDEGEYAYAGQLMLQGIPPYKLAYNMKLPGTYAAYAIIMAIFGQTPSGIHFGLALVNCASIILMYFLGRKLLDGDEIAGIVAAVSFGLLSTSPFVLGLAGHATHFVVLPALAATLLLLRATEDQSSKFKIQSSKSGNRKSKIENPKLADPASSIQHTESPASQPSTLNPQSSSNRPSPQASLLSQLSTPNYQLFASGLLFGLAFLMKQHGIFFGIAGGLYLFFAPFFQYLEALSIRKRNYGRLPRGSIDPVRWGLVMKRIAIYSSGCLIPYLLTCLLLWCVGVFPQFWFWTVSYAHGYASLNGFAMASQNLRYTISFIVGMDFLLWIIPWSGALIIFWDPRIKRDHLILILLLLLSSLAAVSVGFFFRQHYFILLLPVLSLLSGFAFSRCLQLLRSAKTLEVFYAVPVVGLVAFGVLGAMLGYGPVWFGMKPNDVVRFLYGSSLFIEARKVGESFRSQIPKPSRIAVLGSEPEIFFYSRCHSATGYIYVYPLMEPNAFTQRMHDRFTSEIEASKPKTVVFVDDLFSWLPEPAAQQRILAWWEAYYPSRYDIASTITLTPWKDEQTLPALRAGDPTIRSSASEGAKLLIYKAKEAAR